MGVSYPANYSVELARAYWNLGRDTFDIARLLNVPESRVYNDLAKGELDEVKAPMGGIFARKI